MVRTDFEGSWLVKFDVASCQAERPSLCARTQDRQITLRLRQSSENVQGVILAGDEAIALAGSVVNNGELVLRGERAGIPGVTPTQKRALRLYRLGHDAVTGTLEAESLASSHASSFRLSGRLESVAPRKWLNQGTAVSGTWRGGYAVTRCVIEAGRVCRPDPVGTHDILQLSLRQVGGLVHGTLQLGASWSFPVYGTAQQDRLTLRGRGEKSAAQLRQVLSLTAFDVTVDAVGVMTGTLENQWEARGPSLHNASRAFVTLVNVVKQQE